MIPIKLALRNFMCYRNSAPQLYFEGFHVACLCGDNGNGKSALLDAITWALWGKARARSDDDLIYLGEAEMEVEFEFTVGHTNYRVLRKRVKGGLKRAGQTVLELQVETAQGFTPITGNSIGETQRKIIEILRMDYQTFINSALLLQGRSDEFSLKRPGERKEVLANILGLSLYDDLEKLARNSSKERELEHRSRSDDLIRIGQQVGQREKYEAELRETQEAVSVVSGDIEKKEIALNNLRQYRDTLKFKEEQNKEIARQIEQANQQLHYLGGRAQEHRSRIERYERVLSSYTDNSAGIKAQLDDLIRREQDLGKKRECVEELSNRIHYLNSINSQLKRDMEELKSKLVLLGQGEAECPLCGTELGVEGRERIMTNYEVQGKDKGDAYRVNLSEIQQKERELVALRQ
ncbi:MAG: SMC family ATPase, partial [Chloroflexota bacterium]|nr:SMC family ATPase [Chloroflexota bacterium]